MYCPFLCSRVVSATLIADTLGLRLTYDVKGGGMLASASDQDTVKLGNNIILTGLFLQIMFFAIFVVVAGVFHKRMQASPMGALSLDSLPRQLPDHRPMRVPHSRVCWRTRRCPSQHRDLSLHLRRYSDVSGHGCLQRPTS
jgi:hypothetical protein